MDAVFKYGAKKAKAMLGEPTSGVGHIMDWLSRPNYASANIAQFIKGESPYENIGQAAWAGLSAKNRITYSSLTGDPWSGLALDIVLDPTTWVPFGALAKAFKATRIPSLAGRAMIELGEKIPFLGEKGAALKKAFMVGFVDKLYRTKIISGTQSALNELTKLKISDDVIDAAKAGTLTDELLKTVDSAASPHLKKVQQYYNFVRETQNLPRNVRATGFALEDTYLDMLKDYDAFEKANPEKAKALLSAMEHGLAVPENGYWGVSKKLIAPLKELGLGDDDIARIQHEVIRPEIIGANRETTNLFKDLGRTMDNIPGRPAQWSLAEYRMLMDEALKNLDPSIRRVYDNALRVQQRMMDEGLKRQFLLAQEIEGFANRTGLAHVRHLAVTGNLKKAGEEAVKFGDETGTKLHFDLTESVTTLRTNLKELGVEADVIEQKVKSLHNVVDKIAKNKFSDIVERPEMIVEMEVDIRKYIGTLHSAPGVRATLDRLKKIAEEYKEFRAISGTIADIHARTGKKIFETNLAAIFLEEETRLEHAIMYQDYLKKLLASNMDFVKAIPDPKAIIDIPKDFARIDDNILGSFIVHKDLLQPFRLTVNFAAGKGDDFMAAVKLTDKVTSAWKYGTLIPFPKFHIRNLASEISFNMISGMNPLIDPRIMDDYKWAAQLWFKGQHGKGGKEYYELIKEGVIQTGFMRAEAAIRTGHKLHKIPVLGKGFQWMEKAGSFTEEVPRMAMYRWAKRGGAARLKKYSVHSPAELVRKFHIDYSSMTQFETGFLRRIMPFYSWYRFNIPFHIKNIPNAPGFYANVEKSRGALTQATGGTEPEWWMPEYIREGYAIGWGGTAKRKPYVILRGWYPVADINSILSFGNLKDQFLSMLHPIKFVPETIWGYDTFRKRKIPAWPGEKKEIFGARIPAKVAHLLSPIRAIKEANVLIFGTGNKMDSFWDRVVYSMMGKMYEVDVEKTKKYLKWDMNRMINDIEKGINKAKDNKDYGTAKKLMQAKTKLEREVKKL